MLKHEYTTQYVNLVNKTPYDYYFSMNSSRKIAGPGITIGLGLNTDGNIAYSYINNQINQSQTYTYSGSLNLSKYEAKKYSFNLRGGPSYTINEFSLETSNNNNAAGFRGSGFATYFLPAKFIISSDINYTYSAATRTFTAQYKTIWNGSIAKTFLKDDKLKISLAANDLLNQNVNFSRGVTGNTITQTNTNGIKRYFMFMVTWDFTKFGTTTNAKN